MKIEMEKIGVDERGMYKWHCPSCHNVVLTQEQESVSCPSCEWNLEPKKKFTFWDIVICYFVACGVIANIGALIFLGALWFFNYSR